MKNKNSVAIFTIAALVIAGSLSVASGMFTPNNMPNVYSESAGLTGFFVLEQMNSDGDVIRYMQSDNLIPTLGKSCALARIFIDPANSAANATGGAGAHSYCVAQAGAYFDVIGLGDSGTGADISDLGYVGSEIVNSGAITTAAISNATGTSYAVLSHTFTAGQATGTIAEIVIASGTSIGESDALGANAILARKDISPTVVIAAADSITVTWRVQVG